MKAYLTVPLLSATPAPLQEELTVALLATRAVREEQRTLAQALQTGRDPKHWYLRLCQLSTEELLWRYEKGKLSHPRWTLRLVTLLHAQFLHNLRRWSSPNLGPVDGHWQSAFTALDLVEEAWSVDSVLTGLHLALRAQLEQDLPRAVAQTLHHGSSSEHVHCRADLYQMSQAMRSAVERLLTQTTAPHLPWRPALPGARLLAETLAFLLQRYVYDEVEQRSRAFERGVQLASRPPCRSAVPLNAAASSRALVAATRQVPDSNRQGEAGYSTATSKKPAACETAPGNESSAA